MVAICQTEGLGLRRPAPETAGGQRDLLNGINFQLAAGEQVALIGPSGAGKTTLLHTLACAERPSSGRLLLSGIDPWALSNRARHRLRATLFLAPQTPPLPPRQRVVNAVLAARLPHWGFWRSLASLLHPVEPQAAFDALARFGLGDKLYARVDRLSGGERQRCGMARLLLSPAKLLLVDEPLSALDPSLSSLTLHTLQQEARARGAALVCSLHQVDLALAHFPRVVGLRGGAVVFDASPDHISPAMVEELYRHGHGDAAQGWQAAGAVDGLDAAGAFGRYGTSGTRGTLDTFDTLDRLDSPDSPDLDSPDLDSPDSLDRLDRPGTVDSFDTLGPRGAEPALNRRF